MDSLYLVTWWVRCGFCACIAQSMNVAYVLWSSQVVARFVTQVHVMQLALCYLSLSRVLTSALSRLEVHVSGSWQAEREAWKHCPSQPKAWKTRTVPLAATVTGENTSAWLAASSVCRGPLYPMHCPSLHILETLTDWPPFSEHFVITVPPPTPRLPTSLSLMFHHPKLGHQANKFLWEFWAFCLSFFFLHIHVFFGVRAHTHISIDHMANSQLYKRTS